MRRLLQNTRGAALIEFAILCPVLLALICGTIEMGYKYTAQTSLTGAVAQAARMSAVTQESSEGARNAAMRKSIAAAMASYTLEPGKTLTVGPTSYDKFGDTFPEEYTDVNKNGKYDGYLPPVVAEPFVDRNGNGKWDAAIPKAANSTGEPGDVISYTATFPVAHLFGFLTGTILSGNGTTLTATAVVRNEPVKTE